MLNYIYSMVFQNTDNTSTTAQTKEPKCLEQQDIRLKAMTIGTNTFFDSVWQELIIPNEI